MAKKKFVESAVSDAKTDPEVKIEPVEVVEVDAKRQLRVVVDAGVEALKQVESDARAIESVYSGHGPANHIKRVVAEYTRFVDNGGDLDELAVEVRDALARMYTLLAGKNKLDRVQNLWKFRDAITTELKF